MQYLTGGFMIIYSVIIQIKKTSEQEWLNWITGNHIPDLMKTGHFLKSELTKLLEEQQGEFSTYRALYYMNSIKEYESYKLNSAPALQKEHLDKFPGKFTAQRELYEVLKVYDGVL
jgi:hypothetical protein